MASVHERYREIEKLIDEEKDAEAIEGLNGIIADDETYVYAHLALAKVLTRTGDHEKAVQHSVRACELEPDDPLNHTAMSMICQKAWAGTDEQKYIQMAEEAMARAKSF